MFCAKTPLLFVLFFCSKWTTVFCDEVDDMDMAEDCSNHGTKHGEHFELNCTHTCTCLDGVAQCRPDLCPRFRVPNMCRKVRRPMECCPLAHCPEELYRADCFTDHEHIHLTMDYLPTWAVLLNSASEPERACMGTILSYNNIYTSPECKFATGSATFTNRKMESLVNGSPVEGAAIKGSISQVGHIELTRQVNDINYPFTDNCERSDCVLFIPSFDPNANRTFLLKGYQVQPEKCQLNQTEEGSIIRCVELVHLGKNTCLNIAGSGVSIRSGRNFYLRGHVIDQPSFNGRNKQPCPEVQPNTHIKYLDECNTLGGAEAKNLFNFYPLQ